MLIANQRLGEVYEITKDRGKDDLQQVDGIKLLAQQQELQQDVEAENHRNAGAHGHVDDQADDIGQRIDGGNAKVAVDRYGDAKG